MKHNLSYYTHNVNSHNHWKFKTLRRKYGWAGEGRFWALNNMIADSDHCRLDISDTGRQVAAAADLDLSLDEFNNFITYLADTCRLVEVEDGHVVTGITQENLTKVGGKREYQRNWARSKSTIEKGNSSIETTGSNIETKESIIEKEQSKVKKIKVKESKKKPVPLPLPAYNSTTLKPIPDLMADCLKDKIHFVEHLMRKHTISEYQVTKALEAFNEHLLSLGESVKAVKDYRLHFQNWLPKQDFKMFRINPQQQGNIGGINDTLNSIGL